MTKLALGCNYSNDYRTTGKLWDIQSSDLWGKDLCLSDHGGTNSVYAHRDKVLQTIKASRDDCSRVTSHLSHKQASRYTKRAFKTEKPKSDSRLSSIREIQYRWLSTTSNSKQPGWLGKQYNYEICKKFQALWLWITPQSGIRNESHIVNAPCDLDLIWNRFIVFVYYLIMSICILNNSPFHHGNLYDLIKKTAKNSNFTGCLFTSLVKTFVVTLL